MGRRAQANWWSWVANCHYYHTITVTGGGGGWAMQRCQWCPVGMRWGFRQVTAAGALRLLVFGAMRFTVSRSSYCFEWRWWNTSNAFKAKSPQKTFDRTDWTQRMLVEMNGHLKIGGRAPGNLMIHLQSCLVWERNRFVIRRMWANWTKKYHQLVLKMVESRDIKAFSLSQF